MMFPKTMNDGRARLEPEKYSATSWTFYKLVMGPVKSEYTSFYHGMGPCGSRREFGIEIAIYSNRTGSQHRAAVTVS